MRIVINEEHLKRKGLGGIEADIQGSHHESRGIHEEEWTVLSKSYGESGFMPLAICQTQKNGGFRNHFYFPEA